MTEDEVKLRRTAYAEVYKKQPLNTHLSSRDKFINWLRVHDVNIGYKEKINNM